MDLTPGMVRRTFPHRKHRRVGVRLRKLGAGRKLGAVTKGGRTTVFAFGISQRIKQSEQPMINHPMHYVRLGVLSVLLSGVFLASAQNGVVRDTAAFFSEASKAEAGRSIAEIGRRFKKDLVIETYPEIPEAVRQGVNLADKPAVNRMFEEWTVKQAKQLRVNGVYILLSKEPAHLQVVVGNETQHNAFTLKDRDALASLMLARLRTKQNDQALLEGVNFVFNTMAGHATARSQPGPTVGATSMPAARSEAGPPWGTILTVVLGLVVVWMVIGLFRSMSSGGGVGAGAGPASGGGGFFSSLLGGMFGAAAGMWLYDQFSDHHGSAWGADQDHSSSGDDRGFSGRDSDYSGSGGDFSGDSGGGDSGGGDSGGGDSGGGDF